MYACAQARFARKVEYPDKDSSFLDLDSKLLVLLWDYTSMELGGFAISVSFRYN